MSSFTKATVNIIEGSSLVELATPMEYHFGSYPSDDVIKVPEGFISDLATVPRFLWWFTPPHGPYSKAAILHDYLYDNAIKTKKYADSVFYEALQVLGLPKWKAKIMYLAVRVGGKGQYK